MTFDEDAKKATKDSVARASQAGLETRDRATDAVDAAPEVAGDLYNEARGTVEDTVSDVPGSAGDALAASRDAIRVGGERVARRVTKQPLEALLLAGAIGYLVGWAVSRD